MNKSCAAAFVTLKLFIPRTTPRCEISYVVRTDQQKARLTTDVISVEYKAIRPQTIVGWGLGPDKGCEHSGRGPLRPVGRSVRPSAIRLVYFYVSQGSALCSAAADTST